MYTVCTHTMLYQYRAALWGSAQPEVPGTVILQSHESVPQQLRPFLSPTSPFPCFCFCFSFVLLFLPSLHSLQSFIMLSTLRVASRSAAAREANVVVIGARQASAWSKVPQGPPVSLGFYFQYRKNAIVTFNANLPSSIRMLFWVSPRPSRLTPSRRRLTWAWALTVCSFSRKLRLALAILLQLHRVLIALV